VPLNEVVSHADYATGVSVKGKVKIEILGRGCRGCRAAELNLRAAIWELRVKATIARVTDPWIIRRRGVTRTPTIAVQGQIVSSGIVPSVAEVKKWLARAPVS
jgi:hypothetical protein